MAGGYNCITVSFSVLHITTFAKHFRASSRLVSWKIVDWVIEWLINQFVDWLIVYLVDCLIDCLALGCCYLFGQFLPTHHCFGFCYSCSGHECMGRGKRPENDHVRCICHLDFPIGIVFAVRPNAAHVTHSAEHFLSNRLLTGSFIRSSRVVPDHNSRLCLLGTSRLAGRRGAVVQYSQKSKFQMGCKSTRFSSSLFQHRFSNISAL